MRGDSTSTLAMSSNTLDEKHTKEQASKTSRRRGGTSATRSGGVSELARRVQKHLLKKGIETPVRVPLYPEVAMKHIQDQVIHILGSLGLSLHDDSIAKTPERVARMYVQEVFYGLDYRNFPDITAVVNKMRYDELLATKCTVRSMCEHHLVPFIGHAWVGYIPKTKILGLSKFNRVVDFFCRRPQIQERLTAQITAALQLILDTEDVACVIRAQHMCVALRGIEDHQAETITSEMGGRFFKVAPLRQEFLSLTRQNNH